MLCVRKHSNKQHSKDTKITSTTGKKSVTSWTVEGNLIGDRQEIEKEGTLITWHNTYLSSSFSLLFWHSSGCGIISALAFLFAVLIHVKNKQTIIYRQQELTFRLTHPCVFSPSHFPSSIHPWLLTSPPQGESEHSNETNKKLPEIDEISFGGRQYIIFYRWLVINSHT